MQKNPWPIIGHLEKCFLFTWRMPLEVAVTLLPPPLELVTRGGFAFWNVVVCKISRMRPWPMPGLFGVSYWHVAYRLYAKARLRSGQTVEGLYFLRSDCDRDWIAKAGNYLTDFSFHAANIMVTETEDAIDGSIQSLGSSAQFFIERRRPGTTSAGSPFSSVEEAEEFLKYRPCGLSPCGCHAVNAIRIVRKEEEWKSKRVLVPDAHWDFFEGKPVVPELAWEIDPIEYQWNRGEVLEVNR